MNLTREEIESHYLTPLVKETIIKCSTEDGYQRAGNYDFTGWYKYKDDKRQLYNFKKDYDEIIKKTQRSLYWTLNLFENKTFNIQDNQDQRLGTGKETTAYTLGIDIDIKDGYDITTMPAYH
jgi:hypothetical protein